MFWVIDRFEGDFAILVADDRAVVQFPKANLPAGLKEGDVLRLDLAVDEAETERRRAQIAKEAEDLWK